MGTTAAQHSAANKLDKRIVEILVKFTARG